MSQTLLNYQQVLEQLQESANKIADVTELLENQSELVLTHNEDNNAHGYIQQRINEISTLNPIIVTNAVSSHDSSATSHSDLRSRLTNVEQAINNVGGGTIANAIDTSINTHNQSDTAHSDLRNLISNMASSTTITNTINDAITSHNNNTEAHPAIRDQIDTLAVTVAEHSSEIQNVNMTLALIEETINSGGSSGTIPMTSFTHGFPNIVKPNSTHQISFSGIPTPPTGSMSFSIDPGESGLTFSKTSNIAAGENVTVTVPTDAVRGAIKTFSVTVAYSDTSDTGTSIIAFAINRLPDVNSASLSLPAIVKPNSTHSVTILGASDADGQSVTFNISCNKSYVSFSKSTGLTANENFNIIYSDAAVRGETPTFTLVANDGLETASKVFNTGKVNSLPVSSSIVANGLETSVLGGSAYSFNLSGASDADGQSLTYRITGGTGLNLTLVDNIQPGANIVFVPTKVATATNITISVFAVDSLGEQSSSAKNFTITVNPIMRINTPSIISPTSGASIDLPYTFQISPFSESPEL